MKKIGAILVSGVLAAAMLAGCAADNSGKQQSSQSQSSSQAAQEEVKAEPLNLNGTWKSTNSASPDSWQEAVIDGATITVYWVSNNGETKSLYWAGSVVDPTDKTVDDTYTWDSVNDKAQTANAMLASNDDTKAFTYEDGKLSYEATAMGTTKTVIMERVS